MQENIIGERLRNIRQQKGITQQDIELESGLASGHISRIEGGELNPTKETLLKIAQYLRLSSQQQSVLLGTSDQPPTKEEFLEALPYIKIYLEESENPILVSDVFGYSWIGNSFLFKMVGIEESKISEVTERLQRTHILEWFFNPASPLLHLLSPDKKDYIQINQTLLFIDLVNYFERKNEPWLKELIVKLEAYPDFKRVFKIAIEQAKSGTMLKENRSYITTSSQGKSYTYIVKVTYNFKFPRFVFSEFLPEK